MANIFESDFSDFVAALNISDTEYLVVGGYAEDLIQAKKASGRYKGLDDIEKLQQ